MIGDFKLPLNFIIKPHSALIALVASCQTHKDMRAHTQAHANMPPEPIIQGNYQQIHVKAIRKKRDSERRATERKLEVPCLQRAKKYLLKRLMHTNQRKHTEQRREIRMAGT